MVRDEIKALLKQIYPEEIIIIDYVPPDKKGDYSTNLAMRIAGKKSISPLRIAEEISQKINSPIISETIIYPPGFINFVLNHTYVKEKFKTIEKCNIGKGLRVNVEFVSVNPTGPINIVNGRAAAFGDALVRLLNYAGYDADAEYYINDCGRQIDLLAESIKQRMNQLLGKEFSIPEDGYHGEYLIPLAKKFLEAKITEAEVVKEQAVNYFLQQHQEMLENFRVKFKNWIRESEVRNKGYVDRVMKIFREKGLTFEQDGALYLKTTAFNDTRDRVIITGDGRYTYLLPDIAYHLYKIERNYQFLITILGPDHLGQVGSLYAGLKGLDYSENILKIIIVQEVKLKKDGRYISMSKRAGTFITLEDLLNEIPIDVCRFFFLMRSSSQHLDFDLDLAKNVSEENPVYYVQYAYARIMSIIRFAQEKGISMIDDVDLNLLNEKEEMILMKYILRFEETIEDAVKNFEPFMITYYLIGLARIFHHFYQKHRVVGDNEELTRARLFLIKRTAQTLKTGMELLGCSCPEKM
ncbi:MAG: arginine--tRNA ligase [candidate division WOR-3 bacterium]|nr:arginine--tRNA ligase [candidate division WOR-3 bacterium]